MLLLALLGLALWIVISIPVALYFARAMALEEGAPEGVEIQEGLAQLDSPGPPPTPPRAIAHPAPRRHTGAAA